MSRGRRQPGKQLGFLNQASGKFFNCRADCLRQITRRANSCRVRTKRDVGDGTQIVCCKAEYADWIQTWRTVVYCGLRAFGVEGKVKTMTLCRKDSGLAGLTKWQNAIAHTHACEKILWKQRSSKREFVDGVLMYQLNQAGILQKMLIIIDPIFRSRLSVACHQRCWNWYQIFISYSKNQEDGSWKVKVSSRLIVADSFF